MPQRCVRACVRGVGMRWLFACRCLPPRPAHPSPAPTPVPPPTPPQVQPPRPPRPSLPWSQCLQLVALWAAFLGLQFLKQSVPRCSWRYAGLYCAQACVALSTTALFIWQASERVGGTGDGVGGGVGGAAGAG